MENGELKVYPVARPELNPVDLYRCAITDALVDITGISSDLIYPALQWQTNLTYGDLVLPVPRLQVKGTPPPQLATKWVEQWAEKVTLSYRLISRCL